MAEDDVACLLADEEGQEVERTVADDDVNILAIGESQEAAHSVTTDNVGRTVGLDGRDAAPTDHSDAENILASEQTQAAAPVTTTTRSSSRSRRRHRHRRNHHRRRPHVPGLKGKETNFVAAVCSMIVMVAVCTALVEPQWFMVYGGGCRDGAGNPVSYIGMNEFLRAGHFESVNSDKHAERNTKYIYIYGSGKHQALYDCVTPNTVQIIHCVLAYCFIVIALSLVAFLLDLAGPSNRLLKALRRNAVFNILAVLFCVMVNGFCYWVTEHLYFLQDATKSHASSRIEVQFSVSFYLMAAAGAISVLAAACNLLKTNIHHLEPREALIDDNNELDMGQDGPASAFMAPPPPPPYSP